MNADAAEDDRGAAAGHGRWKRVLGSTPVKGLCLFAALGPPIGAWVLLALMLAAERGPHGRFGPDVVSSGIAVFAMFGAFGYVLGAVPAAATGLVAGWIRQRGRLRTTWHCLLVALLAAALATLYGAWKVTDRQIGTALIMFGLPGFVGGLCCALLFRERRRSA